MIELPINSIIIIIDKDLIDNEKRKEIFELFNCLVQEAKNSVLGKCLTGYELNFHSSSDNGQLSYTQLVFKFENNNSNLLFSGRCYVVGKCLHSTARLKNKKTLPEFKVTFKYT